MSEYLTAGKAAAILRVTSKTVARWARDGRLPHFTTLGGHRRYPREAIEQMAGRLEHPVEDHGQ